MALQPLSAGRRADLHIRRLCEQDAVAYRALRLRALAEHPEAFTSSAEEEAGKPLQWSAKRITAAADRPHDLFLGAFEEHALLGMVGMVGRYRPKERHNASVVGMYVASEVAGRGVGAALLQALIEQARAMPDLEQLDLTVTDGNDRARSIYTRGGFTEYGALPRAIKVAGRYHGKVHMVLRLR